MEKYNKYSLINYFDVWYSEEEGWIVNNCCTEFYDLMMSDDATDEDIIKYLIDINFLTESAIGNVYVEDLVDMIEINELSNDMPICSLRLMN